MNPPRSTPLSVVFATFALLVVTSTQAAPQPPNKGARQPDLRIGFANNAQTMRGNNIYNSTARGQSIRVTTQDQKWKNFFFALENDGNEGNRIDSVKLRGTASNRVIETRYFRLSRGRENITAQMTRLGVTDYLTEGGLFKYQGMVRYRSSSNTRNQSVNVIGRSRIDPTNVDVVRARVTD